MINECSVRDAESLTGLNDKTIRRKIKSGEIKARLDSSKRYWIDKASLQPYIDKQLKKLAPYMMPAHDVTFNQTPSMAYEDNSNVHSKDLSARELVEMTNAMFKQFSDNHEKMTRDYREIVNPIAKSVVTPTQEEMINVMQNGMRIMLTNFIELLSSGKIDLSPEKIKQNQQYVVDMLLQGLNFSPDDKKELTDLFDRLSIRHGYVNPGK